MDRRLLRYYNRELQHIREMGGEFAKEFPKIAGRLSLDEFACADPYVERLLEGFAFLSARVHLKLDAEFPRFTQSMLETVYPHYLAPTPSMAVVRFQPDLGEGALAEGFVVPRDTGLRSQLGKGDQTACEYRTAHDVTLWPIQIVEAQYHTRDLPALGVSPALDAKAGVRIRIKCTAPVPLKEVKMDRLVLYLHGTDERPMRIYEQIFGKGRGFVVQPTTKPPGWQEVVKASGVSQVGFTRQQQLLPFGARSFQGYRLIHEYFAFPQRFMSVELSGLAPALRRAKDNQLDIILLAKEVDLELENVVDASSFVLFCTPAANLFPKRADRIHLTDRFSEYHVVADRTRPLDFEVYQVQTVTGIGTRADQEQEFRSFYSATDFEAEGGGGGAYFAMNRVPRTPSEHERIYGRRSSYPGSEVYVTLVDAKAAPYSSDLKQLALSVLCTNRDLPLQMPVGKGRTDFAMDKSGPVQDIRCVSGPTPPKPSYAEGEMAWRAISHLALNYLSLVDSSEQEGAAALRDLMKLYGESSEPQIRKQIDGVKSVSVRPITRRVQTPGPIAFARGLEVTVTLDEAGFEGTGVFLLGAVLEQFFCKYVAINSFTETVIKTLHRGEIMRWPARVGQRQIL
jgi:type VI secretion system protein ImpG